MKNILAIDASLTSTGVCCWTKRHGMRATTVKGKRYGQTLDQRFKRYDEIIEGVFEFWYQLCSKTPVVLIEGFPYGVRGRAVVDMGELGGMLRRELRNQFGSVPIEVGPTALKKFTTGNHMASKKLMAHWVYAMYGERFSNSDETDAYALCWLGRYLINRYDHGKFDDFELEVLTNLRKTYSLKDPNV